MASALEYGQKQQRPVDAKSGVGLVGERNECHLALRHALQHVVRSEHTVVGKGSHSWRWRRRRRWLCG